MAGASDYFVGNAPNGVNYAAPLIGMQLGDRLADLPNQYFQGTQRARRRDDPAVLDRITMRMFALYPHLRH
jgi:hypothetical protein